MIPIYIILRDGQPLLPKVLDGILNQDIECCIIPITSAGGTPEENRMSNWTGIKDIVHAPYFIAMDSDVVLLHHDMIRSLIRTFKNSDCDMLGVPSRKCSIGHQLFIVKTSKFSPKLEGKCCICELTKRLNFRCLYKRIQVENDRTNLL